MCVCVCVWCGWEDACVCVCVRVCVYVCVMSGVHACRVHACACVCGCACEIVTRNSVARTVTQNGWHLQICTSFCGKRKHQVKNLSVSVCLTVYLSVRLSGCIAVCRLSVCLVRLSVCLSVWPVSQFGCLSLVPSVCLLLSVCF